MKKIILTLILFLSVVISGIAQETYDWKKFRIKATVPEGMTVVQNNEDGLVLSASNFTFGMVPSKGMKQLDKLSDAEIKELIAEFSKQMKMDTSQLEADEFECKNGEGAYFVAPNKEKAGWQSLFAFVGNEKTNKFAIVMMSYEEDMAELAGQVLGLVEFY